MAATELQVRAALEVVFAVADAIRALGEVPSGELYAQLMVSGLTLGAYQQVIETLKGAKGFYRHPTLKKSLRRKLLQKTSGRRSNV